MSAYHGEKHHKAKFSDAVVREILSSKEVPRVIADRLGVSISQVHKIRRGVTRNKLAVTSGGQVFRSTRDVLFANTDGPGGAPALPNNQDHPMSNNPTSEERLDAMSDLPSKAELKREYPKGCAAPTGYLAWHEWAEAQDAHGLKQHQCDWCKRWYFPQEKPEHMRCKP